MPLKSYWTAHKCIVVPCKTDMLQPDRAIIAKMSQCMQYTFITTMKRLICCSLESRFFFNLTALGAESVTHLFLNGTTTMFWVLFRETRFQSPGFDLWFVRLLAAYASTCAVCLICIHVRIMCLFSACSSAEPTNSSAADFFLQLGSQQAWSNVTHGLPSVCFAMSCSSSVLLIVNQLWIISETLRRTAVRIWALQYRGVAKTKS